MDKIITIIPAPTNMYVRYACENSAYSQRVVCLALNEKTEEGTTFQIVEPMMLSDDGDGAKHIDCDMSFPYAYKPVIFFSETRPDDLVEGE